MIEKIGERIIGISFKDAHEYSIIPLNSDFEKFNNQRFASSQDGYILINSDFNEYHTLKAAFAFLAERPMDELQAEYQKLKEYFGSKTLMDVDDYEEAEDKANLMFYELIPVELMRREYGSENIENGIIRFWTKL